MGTRQLRLRGTLLFALAFGLLEPGVGAQKAAGPPVRWKELGPAPIANASYAGRISAVACSPTDANRYFIGGADSGVWRTSDGGQTWKNLSDALATTSIGALALDPSDENIVYAGTGEANYANHSRYGLGLLKSIDGGDSWEQLAEADFAGRCFARLVVDPSDGQRLFAAITRAGGFPELAAAKNHPGALDPVGVYRSLNGGVSWTRLTALPNRSATDVALDPTQSNTVYAAIGRIFGSPDNGLYKSIDGGDTWSQLAGGLPGSNAMGRISLSVAPSQPQRLYALITVPASASGGGAFTQGAYRSDNGGANWTTLALGNIQASYGWYLSVVGVDPQNADRVVFGGLSLHRSSNAGASFTTITPPHVDLHAAAFDADGRLVVGDDGGVHRSANFGTTWSPLNEGLGTVQFYAGLALDPNDPDVVLGGTQDNGTNLREAAGLGWTQVFGGDGGWTEIDPTNSNRLFVEFQGTGNLYLSSNGGASFNFTGSGIDGGDRNAFLPPFLIDPSDPSRMFYGTHRLWRSTNGGGSWTAISVDLTQGAGAIRALAMAPSDPQVIYAATNDGNVQVSTDGGVGFQLVLTGQPGWPRVTRELAVHPLDASTAYLAGSAFGVAQIQRTTDTGQSWLPFDTNLPDVPVNVIAIEPASAGSPERIFAGTDTGLLVTRDDGQSWRPFGIGLPRVPVIDLRMDPPRRRLVAGTQGRGAWQAALDGAFDVGPAGQREAPR